MIRPRRGARPPTSARPARATRTSCFTAEGLFVGGRRHGRPPGRRGRLRAGRRDRCRPHLDRRADHRRRSSQAVQLANDDPSSRRPTDDPELRGMGTTLCAIARGRGADGRVERLAIVNVGDSRVYLLKDGALDQVTDDHSLVADARAPGPAHPGGGGGAPAAQHHHPGPRHRRPVDGRLVGGRARSPATATCSAATACSTRSTRTASRPRCAASPIPTDAAERAGAPGQRGRRPRQHHRGHRRRARRRAAPATAIGRRWPTSPRCVADGAGSTRSPGVRPTSGVADPSAGADRPGPSRRAKASTGPRPRRSPGGWWLFVVAGAGCASASARRRDHRTTAATPTSSASTATTSSIYRGRPGGVLWIEPELVERTDLTRDDVPAGVVAEIERGQGRAHARRRPALRGQPRATRSPATTTTTTHHDHGARDRHHRPRRPPPGTDRGRRASAATPSSA